MVLELEKDAFVRYSWKYFDSEVYNFDNQEVGTFDRDFTPKKKG